MNNFINAFYGAGNDIKPADVSPSMQALLDRWQAAIRDGGIGFLPRRAHQRTYWYAFAHSPRQRRELLGLLDAWVGPTYSDLEMGRGELDLSDPFDSALADLEVAPLRFEVLPRTTPPATEAKEAVRNALLMLTRLVNERPASQFEAMRTTVEILDDLGHAIAARDLTLAEACIAELEQSADLDETNLAFLRLRFHAGMQNWSGMLEDRALNHVLSMRRPLGVTRVIQSGLYHERFKELDHQGAESALRTAAEQLEPIFRGLYTGAPPENRAEAVVELVCRLLVTPSLQDSAIVELLHIASGIQPGLDEQFRRIVEAFVPSDATPKTARKVPVKQPSLTPMAQIADLMLSGEFAACIELGLKSDPTVETGRALVYAARHIGSTKWANRVVDYLVVHELMEVVAATTPVLRADVEWLRSARGESLLDGWEDWFVRLDSHGSGKLGLPSAPLQSWKPLPASRFTALLTQASEATLAKLGEGGGQFMAAHSDLFKSVNAAEITLRLIAAMALSGKASSGVRVQTLALIESLTASDPSQSTYEDVLDWTAIILETNTAATTAAWACDIVQTLTSIPAPSSLEAVLSFYFKVTEALRPYRTALDSTDIEGLELVAGELGTELPVDFRAAVANNSGKDFAAPYRYLDGKTVALYSLTETAIARAGQVLKRLVPTVDIRTNSEHDGSPQLAQLSANADLFVVVTAAAKHAATISIENHRGNRPIVRVNSRGSSAILRELANFSL